MKHLVYINSQTASPDAAKGHTGKVQVGFNRCTGAEAA